MQAHYKNAGRAATERRGAWGRDKGKRGGRTVRVEDLGLPSVEPAAGRVAACGR
jgi:hypothetical protein